MDWTALENRLAQAIGLDSSSLGTTVFRQAIDRRMRTREVATLPNYIELLDADSVELQVLVEELVVRESWFFRHAHAFDLLRRHATSTIAERRAPYRGLSFPCAGGEEPYSIAMSLREAGLDFHQFQVDAADISEVALQKAGGGKYGLRSVRVVAPAIQDRYFHVTSDGVEVRPEIRQAVRFTQANIVESQGVLHGNTYDAVFCRNLVIYLTPTARRRIMQDVNRWLSPGGLLFVGHAEMLSEFDELFEPVQERGAFAYCRRSAPKSMQLATPVPVPLPVRSSDLDTTPIARLSATPSNKGRYIHVIPSEAPSDPSSTKNSIELLHIGPSAASHELMRDELLDKVSDLSNASRHPEAIEACKQRLLQEGPSPQGYYLLGMVLQAAGLHEEAAQALERVIYLDPQHDEALLALSLLARRRGDVQIAKRFEQRSQRAHDRRVRP